jgi:hypothetical protein
LKRIVIVIIVIIIIIIIIVIIIIVICRQGGFQAQNLHYANNFVFAQCKKKFHLKKKLCFCTIKCFFFYLGALVGKAHAKHEIFGIGAGCVLPFVEALAPGAPLLVPYSSYYCHLCFCHYCV